MAEKYDHMLLTPRPPHQLQQAPAHHMQRAPPHMRAEQRSPPHMRAEQRSPHAQQIPIRETPRNGEGSSTYQFSDEIKRQKRMKLFKYIGAFILFQIIVLTVVGLIVMKVRTPKLRLGDINIQTLNSVPAAPSFDASFTTQIRVKNPNWGSFKFDGSTAMFTYQGATVGQVVIPQSKAKMRSTKKIGVTVSLNSNSLQSSSDLGSELKSGMLTLRGQAKLSGKVEIMAITKKRKSAQMDCAIVFDLSKKAIQALECK